MAANRAAPIVAVAVVAMLVGLLAVAHAKEVRIQAWEHASPTSIAMARECLPPVLQALYLPAMNAATVTALNQSDVRLQVEEAILYSTYQHLSAAWSLCKSIAQGIRLGAHIVNEYADTWATTPLYFPRLSLTNGTETCTAAIDALPTPSARDAVYEAFRHRFTSGTVCLRRYTVHGRVPTALGVV